MVLYCSAIRLRARYAVPGTDAAYGDTQTRGKSCSVSHYLLDTRLVLFPLSPYAFPRCPMLSLREVQNCYRHSYHVFDCHRRSHYVFAMRCPGLIHRLHLRRPDPRRPLRYLQVPPQ
eukprot:174850-Rhodomonas_salina.1